MPEELRRLPEQLAQDRGEDQRQDERRQDQEEVGDAHQERIGPTADESGDDADDRADRDRDDRGHQADGHRDARSVNHEIQDVPTELVRPEDVGQRGRLEFLPRCAGDGLERPDELLREQRADREQPDDQDADDATALPGELAQDAPEPSRAQAPALGPRTAGEDLGGDVSGHRCLRGHVLTLGSSTP